MPTIPASQLPWPSSQQAVRDLLWAINSPSLIVPRPEDDAAVIIDANVSHAEAHFPFGPLSESSIAADTLVAFLTEQRTHRVGLYFEHLIHFYLAHVCELKVVERGLQIREDKRTIGELDFVYRDRSGDLVHLEIAVKFFLCSAVQAQNGSHLIGPNSADNFERKMHRLFEHQLPLSRSHGPRVIRRQALVRGRIFYHLAEPPVPPAPKRLSPSHLRGRWLRTAEAALMADKFGDCCFRILPKPFWLSTDHPPLNDASVLMPAEITDQLAVHFSVSSRPLLLSVLSEGDSTYNEIDRVFVVADHWPMRESRGTGGQPADSAKDAKSMIDRR